MNKIYRFAILIAIMASCSQQEPVNQTKNYESKINVLNQTFDAAVSFSFGNFKEQLTKTGKNQINYNQKQSIAATLKSLDGKYFIGKSFNYNLIADNFPSVNLPEVTANGKIQDFDINQYSFYSKEQKELSGPFLELLINVSDPKDVASLSIDFNDKIANSKLNEDEKFELFALSSVSNSLAKFLTNGGVDVIYAALSEKLNSEINGGRMQGCSVNWRNVWLGGVVGFFGGGAAGAYTGCTGGTVVLPGVGTAAGCVGGAVLGAAGGFIGASVSGVASELLGSCFR